MTVIDQSSNGADFAASAPWREYSRLARVAMRYAVSAFGPLSVSGAHFVFALILLRALPRADFGLFSFAIVVSALCLGLAGALVGAPLASMAHLLHDTNRRELDTCLKANLALGFALAAGMFGVMLLGGALPATAAMFGIYGSAMALRSIARIYAYSINHARAVVLSDCTYSVSIVLGLVALASSGAVQIFSIAALMAVGAVLALFPFGAAYSRALLRAAKNGSLRAYPEIWRNTTSWSLLGVVTTEITSNASAYLVTFISGSQAFALLAVGSLFMRPFSLLATALPEQERPAMVKSIAAGTMQRTLQIAMDFRIAVIAIWAGTVALAVVILIWFPGLLIKSGYSWRDVASVVALCAAITGVRAIRAPDAVLLQAALQFRALANASVKSSIVTFLLSFGLLLAVGPVASLGGVLIGDLAMMIIFFALVRDWKARHPAHA